MARLSRAHPPSAPPPLQRTGSSTGSGILSRGGGSQRSLCKTGGSQRSLTFASDAVLREEVGDESERPPSHAQSQAPASAGGASSAGAAAAPAADRPVQMI